MKKSVLLLILFIVARVGSAYSFNADSSNVNYIDANGKKQGHWIIFGRMQKDKSYANYAKVEEGKFVDDSKTGIWVGYFPNGNKKSEFTYVNNRPNGPAISYNEKGIKTEEGTWVGTHWVGTYQLFYDDGTPRQAYNYNQFGVREGKETDWNPNGTVAIEWTEKNGKEDGWKKEYDGNGNLVRETFYNGGAIDNSKTIVHEVKPTVAKADVVVPDPPPPPPPQVKPPSGVFNGEGQWTLYQNGQVSMKGTFHNKKLVDGEYRIYDNNGMLTQIKLYKGGAYIGDGPISADENK